MKKTQLVWRLKEQPTTESLRQLVEDKILTKEEARQILFSSEEDRDKKSLESEIKFLRELVEKLSNSKSQIVTIIKDIGLPYKRYDWYAPYATWTYIPATITGDDTTGNYSISGDFTSISTF
jgi:hypothetical protein